jgi:hypothetical protein
LLSAPAGTLVVGTGGLVALELAARRQRSTELTLVHTEHDATERRITELYTKAADQLGSDQVRSAWPGSTPWSAVHRSTLVKRHGLCPRSPEVGARDAGLRCYYP